MKVNLYEIELFEIELFICLKMDLVLNNLQWLICHKVKSKVGDLNRGWLEFILEVMRYGNFSTGEGATLFPGSLHFIVDPYLIMLSVKQGGIKFHFWSL